VINGEDKRTRREEHQEPFEADHRMNVHATTAIANLALASGDRVVGAGAFS